MIAPDNKALYVALLIAAWFAVDLLGIKDPVLIDTIHGLLIGIGVFHAAMTKPGE